MADERGIQQTKELLDFIFEHKPDELDRLRKIMIEELHKKGHKVIWVSSNKDISIELLNKYNIA